MNTEQLPTLACARCSSDFAPTPEQYRLFCRGWAVYCIDCKDKINFANEGPANR